jgi:hypothetical protein
MVLAMIVVEMAPSWQIYVESEKMLQAERAERLEGRGACFAEGRGALGVWACVLMQWKMSVEPMRVEEPQFSPPLPLKLIKYLPQYQVLCYWYHTDISRPN